MYVCMYVCMYLYFYLPIYIKKTHQENTVSQNNTILKR